VAVTRTLWTFREKHAKQMIRNEPFQGSYTKILPCSGECCPVQIGNFKTTGVRHGSREAEASNRGEEPLQHPEPKPGTSTLAKKKGPTQDEHRTGCTNRALLSDIP
jgi:hypothetical protein